MRRNGLLGAYSSILVVLAVCMAAPMAQAAVQVGSCMSGLKSYPTIQLAVSETPNNVTIDVCPGTYAEQVVIPPTNLTLQGVQTGTGATATIVPPSGGLVQNGTDIFGNPVAAQIFVKGPGKVTIKGLTVDGTGNNVACSPNVEGIYFQNASGTITQNVVRNQYDTNYAQDGGCQGGFGINVESDVSGNTVTISTNTVRAYQKNGITATGAGTGPGSVGPAVTITGNYIVGLAATALNWPTSGAAENGIQVGFGASGTVSTNTVDDNIWAQDSGTDTGDAASGILVYASPSITISSNNVNSAQYGIAIETDNYGFCSGGISCGNSDGATVKSNKVAGTQLFDAIDLCSNGDSATGNFLYGTGASTSTSGLTQSGVHIDDTCTNSALSTTSGNNSTVATNNIEEACAAILLGTGTGNTVTPGTTIYDVINTTLAGDSCGAQAQTPMKQNATTKKHVAARVSPYVPHRN